MIKLAAIAELANAILIVRHMASQDELAGHVLVQAFTQQAWKPPLTGKLFAVVDPAF